MSPDAILHDGPAKGRTVAFDLNEDGEPPTYLEVMHLDTWSPIGGLACLDEEPLTDPRKPCLEIPCPMPVRYIRGMVRATGEPAIDSFGRWIYLHHR